jgi:conjugative relaxase-like TrwC/TraI family protein
VISIRRMSLGAGFRYLMESVAVGDGAGGHPSGLVRYYAESGTPPGIFLGACLAGLNDGQGVEKGSPVSEEHLFRMLGLCADPVTGKPVGRSPNRAQQSLQKRIARRVSTISADTGPVERAGMIARIEAEEHARSPRLKPPVAGFDMTFSPSKSVSSAWALADTETKAVIYDCHRTAIDVVLAYAEAEVFHSRSGTDGVVQEDVVGVVAAAFTHWDSRAGDPQLHDHVVVLNRAQSTSDGKWRTLDSRGLFKAVVELSELHQGVLSDLMTEALGWGWDGRARRHSDRLRWEVTGVGEALMAEFSQRSTAIEERTNTLIAIFGAARGRQPTSTEVIALRQRATIETRPDKTYPSLADMTGNWRERAIPFAGRYPESWVASLADRNELPLLSSTDLADGILRDVARVALEKVGRKRATFSRANVAAEVHRQLHGVRFANPTERIAVASRATRLALDEALLITPPELHLTPQPFRRADGTSRFRAKGHEVYTTTALLEAESRLLDTGRQIGGPTVSVATVAAAVKRTLPGRTERLSLDQAVAVEEVATSSRPLDVLVGPAGTGKSTTMAGLRAAWEAEHGPGSVIGLAPSAAAAEVLAEELGIETENTAKWLFEHRRQPDRLAQLDRLNRQLDAATLTSKTKAAIRARFDAIQTDLQRWQLTAGQLIVVDEASLAGTFALDELVSAAGDAGAKVLLVGDVAQLSAVEAGGMFAALVADRDGHVPELTDVRRFRAEWEKKASLALRSGDPTAIDAYENHGRITEGGREELLDALYISWRADIGDGLSSLMIAPDLGTVSELNRRARANLVITGRVSPTGVDVAGGSTAGVGDLVVTRQNDRTLMAGSRWVRNGDRWTVTEAAPDGSLTVRAPKGGAVVVLPARYVAEHVELGYAATAHRAQGRTLDTAHAIVSRTTTREVLYVSATRGRQGNYLYVDTHYDPDPQTGHDNATEPQTVREVLAGVLANEGADIAAHEAIRRAHEQAESVATLAPEYQTISASAEASRWEKLFARSGLTSSQVGAIRSSQAYGPLTTALRDAEARGLNADRAFPLLVRGRTFVNANDVASVLHSRVDRWVEAASGIGSGRENLVVGLFPRPSGVTDPDMSQGLTEREKAIEQRAGALAEQAAAKLLPWVRGLGQPPADPTARRDWLRSAATVAAYRERWGIETDLRPLGSSDAVTCMEQYGQRKRALAAAQRAIDLSRGPRLGERGSYAAITPSNQVDQQRGTDL